MACRSRFVTPSSCAVPALPGATKTRETRSDCASRQASACSRPPEPTTSIFMGWCPESLVPEMPHAGEHHRDAVGVRGGDHFVVAHAAARLDHGARARIGDDVEPVAEGKE